MRSASVGFQCPECTKEGTKQQSAAVRKVQRQNQPYLTFVLVAISVAVFLLDQVWTANITFGNWGNQPVLNMEGSLYGPNVAAGDWWRPITVGFVHGNVIHVGFNMLLLYLLGQMLEPALGRIRYLALFLVSLLGGSALILLLNPDQQTVGASGAVFGLMGAAFIGMHSRGINPFQTAIGPLLLMNLIFTFIIPGVSIAGHIGGLVAGAIAGCIVFEVVPRLPTTPAGGFRLDTQRLALPRFAPELICIAMAAGLYFLCLTLPEAGPTLPSPFDYM